MTLLDELDRQARADGWLQRASPPAKLLGAAAGLLAVILAREPLACAAIAAFWLALASLARLRWWRVLAFAAYALLFAGLYALASWEGEPRQAVWLMARASGAAIVVLVLTLSTPSPRLFQALQPVLPRPLPDALFLTYRAFFLLLDRWYHTYTALRLRGGLSRRHPLRSLRHLGMGLGGIFLGALDRSEALYQAMQLRGYNGRLAPAAAWRWRAEDAAPLAVGALSLGLALVPGSAGPGLLAALGAGMGGVLRWRRSW